MSSPQKPQIEAIDSELPTSSDNGDVSKKVSNVSGPITTETRRRKPKDSVFNQQKLPAWQPILTPYNVIPTLFLFALAFIPIGIILLVFSNGVQEYSFVYTRCLEDAPLDNFAKAPANLGSVPFEWRRLRRVPSSYTEAFQNEFFDDSSENSWCEIRFTVEKKIEGPAFLYYGLSNYYQNQRLYIRSVDWEQMKGKALDEKHLTNCSPLIGPSSGAVNPDTNKKLVYYPCGLIANSMFNDTISGLLGQTDFVDFPPRDITWPYESQKYGPSRYLPDDVLPPPFWQNNRKYANARGTYTALPDLQTDERFQNWMKVSALPVFRKLYGRHNGDVNEGQYTIIINSVYEVQSYGASKSVIISNTSWLGGKNNFLGYAFIVTGGIFLILGIAFLVQHFLAPRRLGDVNQLSWNQNKNSQTH